jgi:hypothetical protein
MLLDEIQINKKLPFASDYLSEKDEIEFLKLSYEADGNSYTLGSCPEGYIIPKLACEEYDDWKVRRELTPIRSYVSSIVDKYSASVFRNEPSRMTQSATYEMLEKDADGYGNSLNKVMKEAVKKAQIEGACYLLADDTASNTEILTIAQQTSSGARPYIRIVPKASVVNKEEVEKKLISAIILLEDSQGVTFARYMDDYNYIDITLSREYMIESISEPYNHGFSKCPLVEIKPFESPQSKQISYSQKTIVNLLSLLNQEMVDHVFSKWVLSGVRLPQDDSGTPQKINYGSKRMIVLEDANAKLDTVTADHGAAESLRAEIKLEEENLYYTAGFGKNNLADASSNMSGFALEVSREDFFIKCNDIKTSAENAENEVMSLIAEKESFDYIPVVYSSRFVVDDNGTELNKLRDALALDLPKSFKNLLVKDYISKFYNVSEEQMAVIEQELLQSLQVTQQV